MKKIFWIPIMIILFLGVGFLYMVKNPELPISHTILTSLGITMTTGTTPSDTDLSGCVNYFDGCNTCEVKDGKISSCTESICQTLAQPKCNEYAWTGIDLTNCISYFDGCNNCTVENGKPSACTLMYCETPAEPKCTQYATGTQPASDPTCVSYFDGCNTCSKSPNNGPTACTEMYCETPSEPKCLEYATGTQTPVGMANPASLNCEKKGGSLTIQKDINGGEIGMCSFSDGTVCEERAYYRGECGPKNDTSVSGTGSVGINPEPPTACTMEYAPVCASVQVQCIKAPCPPIQQTFGNRCTMNSNKLATFLYEGECKEAKISCPMYSPPAPGYCSDGVITNGGKDSRGCQLPPVCTRK